ncbi:uncharacterized protein LOC123315610 [Coccinella septempunctata]|uniref:uncharacterized protein LOC123315610 n=1 Tax=Coccinella septempunctata TaxID=41139 RepID=UPI001D08A3AB|nr:uncharacterized protein LOC123315610 [Coccinella septempunctata]XP_044757304.1 uncharacterized protein LOC123315610 [Coccinella septempunctata]XP_044757305.1 uncharacterized protein LOC123315610 [Coccinella septempunctata]
MVDIERVCSAYKFGWFIIMFINFFFGISGMTICSLKLKYAENSDTRNGFFKISMIFASSNLTLSIFLLIAIIKNSHKYAFLYALLSFINLFTAVIYIESSTTADSTFLLVFSVFASLWLLWFLIYGAYQFFIKNTLESDSSYFTPVGVSV